MLDHIIAPLGLVADPYVLVVVLLSSIYGLFIGAVPGLSATMAVALLVPVTFFMPAVPAFASMVSATAMAIFSGDIPGCLLRIPGTPSSAAYTDEAHAMARKGEAGHALGAGLVVSCIGGLFGTLVLIFFAPVLAEFALDEQRRAARLLRRGRDRRARQPERCLHRGDRPRAANDRANDCPDEWERMSRAWDEMLDPYWK